MRAFGIIGVDVNSADAADICAAEMLLRRHRFEAQVRELEPKWLRRLKGRYHHLRSNRPPDPGEHRDGGGQTQGKREGAGRDSGRRTGRSSSRRTGRSSSRRKRDNDRHGGDGVD